MRSIHSVKEILQAKWAGAQGGAGHQQLSEEAEKILKKAGSKFFFYNLGPPFDKFFFII